MKGVILAAGQGTRMLPLTRRRPKPLVPVVDRPMIEHIITGARDAGVDHQCLIIGHLGEMIQERYGDGKSLGVQLEYIWQTGAKGTGAATLLAEQFAGDEPFFLSWGDIMVPPRNYDRLIKLYQQTQASAILGVNRVDDPWEGAAVYVQNGLVERIEEKPPIGTATTNFNNAGLFVFEPLIFRSLRGLSASARGEVEMPDAVRGLIDDGTPVRAFELAGYWSDVARPATVLELNATVINDRSDRGIIVDHSAQVSTAATLTGPVYVGPGCQIDDGAAVGPGVVLGSQVTVGTGARLKECMAWGPGIIGEQAEISWAIMEEGVTLAPQMKAAGSPSKPLVMTVG